MLSRLFALNLMVPAVIFGLVFGLLALEEISEQTQEVRACVHNVGRETPVRGTEQIPLRPTYLVIETDRNPQKFVHYLGSLQADDPVAERIRPGDCVRITCSNSGVPKKSSRRGAPSTPSSSANTPPRSSRATGSWA